VYFCRFLAIDALRVFEDTVRGERVSHSPDSRWVGTTPSNEDEAKCTFHRSPALPIAQVRRRRLSGDMGKVGMSFYLRHGWKLMAVESSAGTLEPRSRVLFQTR